MHDDQLHSRRAFLRGTALAQTAVEKAQQLVETAAEMLAEHVPPQSPLLLQAARRAMACEFAVQYQVQDRPFEDHFLAAFDLIDEIETQLTIYRESSEVIEINRTAADDPVSVTGGLFRLLAKCSELHEETHGAFDITSTPLSRTWGFFRREGRLPAAAEIEAAMTTVGFQQVELDPATETIYFRVPGVEINFNSIGKGYALDLVADQLHAVGAENHLWHGGSSSVLARGRNAADPHGGWTIGLRHPLEPEKQIAEFYLRNQGLGTAGGATQSFEIEGRRYNHILDPRTGWPAQGVCTSTVVAPTAALADALATAFFVGGRNLAAEFCGKHADVSAAIVLPRSDSTGIEIAAFNLVSQDWTPTEGIPVVTSTP